MEFDICWIKYPVLIISVNFSYFEFCSNMVKNRLSKLIAEVENGVVNFDRKKNKRSSTAIFKSGVRFLDGKDFRSTPRYV